MELYLVRHGKAEAGKVDERRELTDGGRQDVRRVAKTLKDTVRVERVEHSPLIRARQTAEILARRLSAPLAETGDLAPGSDVSAVRERIVSGGAEALMLVGHNPFMEELAALLICEFRAHAVLTFHTGSVAKLIDGFDASGRRFSCDWLLTPRLL